MSDRINDGAEDEHREAAGFEVDARRAEPVSFSVETSAMPSHDLCSIRLIARSEVWVYGMEVEGVHHNSIAEALRARLTGRTAEESRYATIAEVLELGKKMRDPTYSSINYFLADVEALRRRVVPTAETRPELRRRLHLPQLDGVRGVCHASRGLPRRHPRGRAGRLRCRPRRASEALRRAGVASLRRRPGGLVSYPVRRHPADCPVCDGYDAGCEYTVAVAVPRGELDVGDCAEVLACAGLSVVDGEVSETCPACGGAGVLEGECEDERGAWWASELCDACDGGGDEDGRVAA